MERSYQFLIKEINDPQMASETSRDKYYTLIDFIKRTNELEAENEQYHQIVSDMSRQLRKAAEEKAELEKDIKALRESYDFLQFKYDNFLKNIKQILEE